MSKNLLIIDESKEEEVIQCIYCGEFKPPHSKHSEYCEDCLSSASEHLEFMEDVILMKELVDEL